MAQGWSPQSLSCTRAFGMTVLSIADCCNLCRSMLRAALFLGACAAHQGHNGMLILQLLLQFGEFPWYSQYFRWGGLLLWTPPVPPGPTVLPPVQWFGHPQTAAGVVGAAATNKASAVELALPQLNSQLVKSRVICANADCDTLGFRSPSIGRRGLLCTSGWWDEAYIVTKSYLMVLTLPRWALSDSLLDDG